MKKNLLMIAIAAFAIAMGAAPAFAGEGSYMGQSPRQTTKEMPRTGTISTPKSTDVRPEIAKQLKEALDLGKKNDFQGALAKTKEADAAVSDKSPYEDYVIANFLVNYSIKLKDHATATVAINRALATNVVPEQDLPPLLTTAVTLNAEAKNYPQAIAAGEQLQKLGKRDAATETNVAIAYYNSGNYPSALKMAKGALELETANGGKPIEQTLVIMKNAQIKTGDQKGAIQTELQLCDISTTEPKAQCDQARKAAQK